VTPLELVNYGQPIFVSMPEKPQTTAEHHRTPQDCQENHSPPQNTGV